MAKNKKSKIVWVIIIVIVIIAAVCYYMYTQKNNKETAADLKKNGMISYTLDETGTTYDIQQADDGFMAYLDGLESGTITRQDNQIIWSAKTGEKSVLQNEKDIKYFTDLFNQMYIQ